MSTYVDTCVAMSYCFAEEKNHQKALALVNRVREDGLLYTSSFALTELYCTLARKRFKLPPGLQGMPKKSKISGAVDYIIKKMDLKILPDEPQLKDLVSIKVFHKFEEATQAAFSTELPTKDSLHIAYAFELKKKGKIKQLVSLDEAHMGQNKEFIEKYTGLIVRCDP